MSTEMQSMLAIVENATNKYVFYSQMFLVPKKDGALINMNLNLLNWPVKSKHFNMEGIHIAKSRRLDGRNRPERCIFHGPNGSGQRIPQIPVKAEKIPVKLPIF